MSSDAHVEYNTNLWLANNVTSLGIFNDVSVIKIATCSFSPLIDGENLHDDFEIHCVINGCYRLHHHKSINCVDYETCSVIQDVATSTYVAHYHQVNVRFMLNSMPFPPIVIMDGSLRHNNNNTRCLERHLLYFGSQLHDQTGYHSSQLHDQTGYQPQVEVIDRVQVTTDKPFTNGHGVLSSESSATLPIQATSTTFE
eukprot:scaffold4437_cov63-Skeletonema_menzelii.AAC.1